MVPEFSVVVPVYDTQLPFDIVWLSAALLAEQNVPATSVACLLGKPIELNVRIRKAAGDIAERRLSGTVLSMGCCPSSRGRSDRSLRIHRWLYSGFGGWS